MACGRCGSATPACRHPVSTSRNLMRSRVGPWPLTMSTVSSPRGAGSDRTSTSARSRCSRACRGSPAASTSPAAPPSPSTGSTAGSSTSSSALRRAGNPYELSPGQLVAETLVTSGTMTNRVDRLAARGFVERRARPQRPARRHRAAHAARAWPWSMPPWPTSSRHEHALLAELGSRRARRPRRAAAPAAAPLRARGLTGARPDKRPVTARHPTSA